MLVKDREYGTHQEGAKVWDDKFILEKLEGYSLKKIETWHESLGGIKQIKLLYTNENKSAESMFSVYSEEIPSTSVYNFIELEDNEHVTRIQGSYNSDSILKLKIETQLDRTIQIDSHPELAGTAEFSVENKKEEQLYGFFGEYIDNLISFGVYRKKSLQNDFELGVANVEAVSSAENENLASYSKGEYKIKSISIWGSESSFFGLQFSYLTALGDSLQGKNHFANVIHTSKPQVLEFTNEEFLAEISGIHNEKYITYLELKSSHGKCLVWGQKDTTNKMETFQVMSKDHEQLIVSRIRYVNDNLVQIFGSKIPTIKVGIKRGTTFADFEKKTAKKFSKTDKNESENIPQTDLQTDLQTELSQSLDTKSEALYQNNFDEQKSTMKTILFPLKKEVSKSVVMPSTKTLHFYHQASERHALEKDFERKDVFAFLLWFGIGVNITQIMVGISTKPKTQGILISSIVLSALTILVLLNGLRIIGMKSLRAYNRYGFLLIAVIFFSFAVMVASFIQNESVGLSFFSLITTLFLFPVYLKKRRILKEIFLFDPQREQFLSTLDPQSENTNTYKTQSEKIKELMETAESIAKQIEAKKDRPSISANKLDLKLDIE